MTYEQNIRKTKKRLEYAHYEQHKRGVLMKRERAQAIECIRMQAEAISSLINHQRLNHIDPSNIDSYLFNQGLILLP